MAWTCLCSGIFWEDLCITAKSLHLWVTRVQVSTARHGKRQPEGFRRRCDGMEAPKILAKNCSLVALYVTYMFTSCTNSYQVFSSQIGSSNNFVLIDRSWNGLYLSCIFILIVYCWKNYSVIHDSWLQRWVPWMLRTVCVLDLFPAICKPSDSIRYLMTTRSLWLGHVIHIRDSGWSLIVCCRITALSLPTYHNIPPMISLLLWKTASGDARHSISAGDRLFARTVALLDLHVA